MHITLHTTDRCNLACRYCYAEPGSNDMTFEVAARAVELCDDKADCGIIFFGGEPLLCKDLIWDVIRWCEDRTEIHYHYKVTTNGLLLDDRFLDDADNFELHVAMSHDGVREAHDAARVKRDGSGSFDEVTVKLRLLLERRPYAPVMLTVHPDTVETFADSVQWLQGLGAQYLICSVNYAGNWTDRKLQRLKAEYHKLEKWHLENYREEKKMYFSPFDKRIATHVFAEQENSCRLGKRQISVAADGRMYPCVQFVGRDNYVIGSVAQGVDEQKREQIYRCNEADKTSCEGCDLKRRCHNKCGCLNVQTTGSIASVPRVLCEHERIVFPIADRLAGMLYKERNPMFIQRHYNRAFPVLSFLEDLTQ